MEDAQGVGGGGEALARLCARHQPGGVGGTVARRRAPSRAVARVLKNEREKYIHTSHEYEYCKGVTTILKLGFISHNFCTHNPSRRGVIFLFHFHNPFLYFTILFSFLSSANEYKTHAWAIASFVCGARHFYKSSVDNAGERYPHI